MNDENQAALDPKLIEIMKQSQSMFLGQPDFVHEPRPALVVDPDNPPKTYKLSEMMQEACSRQDEHDYKVEPKSFYETMNGALYCVCPLTAVYVRYVPDANWGCLKHITISQGLDFILSELRSLYTLPEYTRFEIADISSMISGYDKGDYDWPELVKMLKEKGF